MTEIEIGRGKSGRRGVALADVSVVPARRTRDRDDVDLSWKIDAYRFDLPFMAAGIERPLDTDEAIAVARHGALAVIDLDAVWAGSPTPEAITEHVGAVKAEGARVAAAVSAGRVEQLAPHAMSAEADLLVISGDVVSAETVSTTETVLNLKTFIRSLDIPVIVGGCASYRAALHLMRTGAAGVIVGVDLPDLGIGVPLASALADARSARVRHLDETGVYCHVIARGEITSGADVARAVACGADAVLVDASVVLNGDTAADMVGNLRQAMATCGYTDLKSFQKAEVVVR